MLIPFGEPPALPTRLSDPSGSASAAALAWSDSQTRPSRDTTTSSGRCTPTPTLRSSPSEIAASGISLHLSILSVLHASYPPASAAAWALD